MTAVTPDLACLNTVHYTEKLELVSERNRLHGTRVFAVGRLRQNVFSDDERLLAVRLIGRSTSCWVVCLSGSTQACKLLTAVHIQ